MAVVWPLQPRTPPLTTVSCGLGRSVTIYSHAMWLVDGEKDRWTVKISKYFFFLSYKLYYPFDYFSNKNHHSFLKLIEKNSLFSLKMPASSSSEEFQVIFDVVVTHGHTWSNCITGSMDLTCFFWFSCIPKRY